jgi:NEDD8-activating enzyme E1 regulatory subunit
LELNPDDVQGQWVNTSIQKYIEDLGIDWLSTFELVIGTNLHNSQALMISERCGEKIPFVLIRQYGLIGSIRIDIPEIPVIESKEYQNKNKEQDLRLNEPFPELMSFAMDQETFNLKALPIEVQGHVPYVVILIQAAESWKA